MRTRSMRTSLEAFSEELLDRVVSFVESSQDLAHLAHVSKRLNRITLPRLYAHVLFTNSWSDLHTKHLRTFAFLMLQRPDLAALVRSFTLRQIYKTTHAEDKVGEMDEMGDEADWPKHPDLDQILNSAIRKHTEEPEVKQKWFEIIRAGHNEAAILSLLLPTLTNLRSMDVPFHEEYDGDGRGIDSEYILQMLRRATEGKTVNELPIFKSLTDIMIPGVDDKYPDDPDWFAASVGLPAVQRIYGHNQGNEDQGTDDPESCSQVFSKLAPCSSPVEYIELRKSKLNIANFMYLLRAPKCLKTMIYEIGNTWAWTDIKFSAMQSALSEQKNSLEKLSLGHMPDYFPFADNDEMTPMSFSAFTSLKHVRIAPIFLYGQEQLRLSDGSGTRMGSRPSPEELASTKMVLIDALPSQLETLGLIHCYDSSSLERIAMSLLEVLVEGRFPKLREVMVCGMKPKELVEHLASLGVLPWRGVGPWQSVRLIVKSQPVVDYLGKEYKKRPWGWDGEVEWGECVNDYSMPVKVLYDSEGKGSISLLDLIV